MFDPITILSRNTRSFALNSSAGFLSIPRPPNSYDNFLVQLASVPPYCSKPTIITSLNSHYHHGRRVGYWRGHGNQPYRQSLQRCPSPSTLLNPPTFSPHMTPPSLSPTSGRSIPNKPSLRSKKVHAQRQDLSQDHSVATANKVDARWIAIRSEARWRTIHENI